MAELITRRSVFHPEADFQHAFAWTASLLRGLLVALVILLICADTRHVVFSLGGLILGVRAGALIAIFIFGSSTRR
ncbi:hypothetical protein U2F26_25590 [Micromonospora sp. 4G57]|uniref:DUF202 domain-containing protein n=1 Tax=Micromonospora sicca TaxID=2202420 RepID=A0ABU5JJQ5_9ACTN|nr:MULTISPECIES: hypothetical protein [unclassified Micromonospora]MDZ5446066.1 hypothetical protein [Micromonospora sp. 4G57]MDZ5492801.1 hypothetical protein [Micromonospora sp. 4G53]